MIVATKGQFEEERMVGVFDSLEVALKALNMTIDEFTYYPDGSYEGFPHYRTTDLRPDGFFNYDQMTLDVMELNKYYE